MRFIFYPLLIIFLFTTISFSQVLFTTTLSGGQEVPAVSTTGTGTAWVRISPDFNSITYRITYARLQSSFSAAHFHVGQPGTNGPVAMTIPFNGNTASGTWNNVPDSIISKLMKEQIYINIHTTGTPSGEIRGDLNAVEGIGFTSSLNGAQEVPPANTTATGTGFAILDLNSDSVYYSITVAGLSSTLQAAHFHQAPAGSNGGVVQNISFADSTATGFWSGFSESVLTSLIKNGIYINVHTANFPSGEIRGQLNLSSEIMLRANIQGSQEVPPVATNGSGTAWAVLNNDLSSMDYNITFAQLQGNFSAAHFHLGAPGNNGPVFQTIMFNGNNASGELTMLPDSIVRAFIKGNVYINIHSSTFPSGEIRGQLQLTKGIGFTSVLNGAQEVPPTATNAKGTGWVSFGVDVTEAHSAYYRITIAGLSSQYQAAHFHRAPMGANGPVVQAIMFMDSTVSGQWGNVSDMDLAALAKGNIYINVHSTGNPAGEIRGQVLFSNYISGNIPVELSSFTADVSGSQVNLLWSTVTETNNKGFEILRSVDKNNFSSVGFVNGNGTSTELKSYSFTDNIENGKYYYQLKQIDFDGTSALSKVIEVNVGQPQEFNLSQNYPNPFNPSTTISYSVPVKGQVSLELYDVIGNKISTLVNEIKNPGSYNFNLNAGGLASGVYFYKLTAGDFISTKKLVLLK